MFAELFILLLISHWCADYPGQTDHQAKHKACAGTVGWRANLAHAGTHAAVTLVLLVAIGAGTLRLSLSPAAIVIALAWIAGTHSIIDRRWPVERWMRLARQQGFAQHGGAAHVDQTAHMVCLMIGTLILTA